MASLWDDETINNYFYIMESAFYDSSVAAEIESDKKFAEENPEEAEQL